MTLEAKTNDAGKELTSIEGTAGKQADKSGTVEGQVAPTPSSAELELGGLKAKYATLENNYKAVQRNLEAARASGSVNEAILEKLESYEERMAILQDQLEMQSAKVASEAGGGYDGSGVWQPIKPPSPAAQPTPTPQAVGKHQAELKAQREAAEAHTRKALDLGNQVQWMIDIAKVDSKDAAFAPVAQAFREGRLDEMLPLARQAIEKLTGKAAPAMPAATATAQATQATATPTPSPAPSPARYSEEDLINLGKLSAMKDMGLLDVDTGLPAAGAVVVNSEQGLVDEAETAYKEKSKGRKR